MSLALHTCFQHAVLLRHQLHGTKLFIRCLFPDSSHIACSSHAIHVSTFSELQSFTQDSILQKKIRPDLQSMNKNSNRSVGASVGPFVHLRGHSFSVYINSAL